MISLDNLTKSYRTNYGHRVVLDQVTLDFPVGRNVGVFGLNGAGKSTLIKLLAGADLPDSGRVRRTGMVSFPLGFDSVFHSSLSGRENVRFISRVYGIDIAEAEAYVEDFAELGEYFDMPLRTYSSGMRAKLAFGTCLAVDFDVYLIDEITEVGDSRFRAKAAAAFRERVLHADVILVSHNIDTVRKYCDMGAVLHGGQLVLHDTIDEAMRHYKELL